MWICRDEERIALDSEGLADIEEPLEALGTPPPELRGATPEPHADYPVPDSLATSARAGSIARSGRAVSEAVTGHLTRSVTRGLRAASRSVQQTSVHMASVARAVSQSIGQAGEAGWAPFLRCGFG